MISCKIFIDYLKKYDIDFFSGVPDSLLSDFSAYLLDNISNKNHVIAANEGNAVAIGAGNYLATGNIPVIYMQNSGIGNIVNPVVSLINQKIYNIPMLFLIGWRGQPNIHDEPQHIKQGEITEELLNNIDIKTCILPKETENLQKAIDIALNYILETNNPYAFIIEKNTFETYKSQKIQNNNLKMTREEAIETVVSNISENDIVVSTTGKISRELFEIRERLKQSHKKDFLTVGSMGHASSIAFGIANANNEQIVYCFDGDGAAIMHMGSMSIIGQSGLKNIKHILFNNGCHESVGGQPTVGFSISFVDIAKACGYKEVYSCNDKKMLNTILERIKKSNNSVFLEINVNKLSRKYLGRPTTTPIQNKKMFMESISKITEDTIYAEEY